MLAAAMLLSMVSFAQNVETLDVSKEKDGLFSQVFKDIRVEGNVKNGKKDGTWYEFKDDRNKLYRVIQYKNGVVHGLWMEMSDNGTVLNKTDYVDGKKEGIAYKWSVGNRFEGKNSYKNDLLDGEQILCYDNGQNQEVSYYKNGLRDGVTTWYNREGKKRMMITYKDGKFEGVQETYYPTGGIKTSKMYKNNVPDGPCIEYYEGGDMKSESKYKDGKVSGKVKTYKDQHPYDEKVAKEKAMKEAEEKKMKEAEMKKIKEAEIQKQTLDKRNVLRNANSKNNPAVKTMPSSKVKEAPASKEVKKG